MPALIGIGNALLDVVARVEEDFLHSHGIPKGAMVMAEAARMESLVGRIRPETEMSGGAVANSLAAAAALGTECGFIGRVCDDAAGRRFRADLEAAGVHAHFAPKESGLPTGRCLVMVSPDGERSMATSLGASAMLGLEDIGEAAFRDAAIGYLEAYLWDSEKGEAVARKAAGFVKAAGGRVALNLSDSLCVDRHRDSLWSFIGLFVDIVIANEAEILAFHRTEDFGKAAEMTGRLGGLAALTRSERGAFLLEDGVGVSIEACSVARVLDVTGAGDAFAGGFLHGLMRGDSVEDSGEIGARAASRVLGHFGARA